MKVRATWPRAFAPPFPLDAPADLVVEAIGPGIRHAGIRHQSGGAALEGGNL